MAVRYPIIPTTITVHLGKPNEAAPNVTVPFDYYIKNVASSELYPTWPDAALRANILAITSFTMNRIYNEWYRSKGYNFDITSSPAYDQTFINDRDVYESIDNIVKDVFNDYVVKGDQIQPYYTSYCDGRKTTCNGLSQWGSVTLANQGRNPLSILRYYYGNDISIVENAPVGEAMEGFPGYDVGYGNAGNPVLLIQRDLNRIRKNYPAIPEITDTLGLYNQETEDAVKKFQEIFALPQTGIVDKATWYKIKYIYNSVKKLSDLYTEGITEEEARLLYQDKLVYGDTGLEVEFIHYYLNALAFLDPDIPLLQTNSVYNDNTKTMVMAFQKKYGLPVTGEFTYADWKVLKSTYDAILKNLSNTNPVLLEELYPGYFLTRGMSGNDVRRYQKLLLKICQYNHSIPGVRVNGNFDELTEQSVKKLQQGNGFQINGLVGPLLWKKTVELSKRGESSNS